MMAPSSLSAALALALPGAALVAGCGGGAAAPAADVVVPRPRAPASGVAVVEPPRAERGRGPAMVAIPGATFRMGSEDGDRNEVPVHQVTVRSFSLDVTEVTAGQYLECVEAGACRATGDDALCTARDGSRPELPVNCVSHRDAEDFCRWAGKRLPTEEEWELAARGPEGRQFPWGDAFDEAAVCVGQGNEGGPCPSGAHPRGATPEGVLDLTGNVWEWTKSRACDYPDKTCDTDRRVNRGGCWQGDRPHHVRGAIRYGDPPETRDIYIGFRCAR